MFKRFGQLLDEMFQQTPEASDHSKELAIGALLVEIALADGTIDEPEEAQLRQTLQQQFHIPPSDVDALINEAKHSIEESVDLYQFTKVINAHFDYPARCECLGALWKMAYADQHLDALEEHQLRKISDLLFVDHSDFIRLKHQARDA